MIDHELCAAVEKIKQADSALGPFEGVRLGDLDHWKFTAFGCEGIAGASGFLLLDEKLLAGNEPVGWRNNLSTKSVS